MVEPIQMRDHKPKSARLKPINFGHFERLLSETVAERPFSDDVQREPVDDGMPSDVAP